MDNDLRVNGMRSRIAAAIEGIAGHEGRLGQVIRGVNGLRTVVSESLQFRRTEAVLAWVLAISVFWGLAYHIAIRPMFGGFSLTTIPTELIDGRLNNFFLEHAYQWAQGRVADFWDGRFFYPHQNTMVLSDSYVGDLPFYGLFRVLGNDRETSYQLWLITGLFLNYLSALVVLRLLGFRLLLSTFGAVLYGLAPSALFHIVHSQLLYRFPVPIVFGLVYIWLARRKWLSGYLAVFFLAWQFYLSPYLGLFLALVAAAEVIAMLLAGQVQLRLYSWASLLALAGMGVFGLVLLHPIASPYSSDVTPKPSREELISGLPRPNTFLIGSRDNYIDKLVPDLTKDNPRYEQEVFPGSLTILGFLGASLACIFWRRSMPPVVPVAVLAVWILWLITVYFRSFSFYLTLVELAPIISGARYVARLYQLLTFLSAVATVGVLALLFERINAFRAVEVQISLVAAALLFVGWESRIPRVNVQVHDKAKTQKRVSRIVDGARNDRAFNPKRSVLVVLAEDQSEHWAISQADALLAAQDLGVPTVNGLSRVFPEGFHHTMYQWTDVASMLDTYETYLPGFRRSDLVPRLYAWPPDRSPGGVWRTIEPKDPPAGNLGKRGYAASVKAGCANCPLAPGGRAKFFVTVQNTSSETWPGRVTGFAGRWLRADGTPLTTYDARLHFNRDFPPGVTLHLHFEAATPGGPGKYLLGVEMLHEGVGTFSSLGSYQEVKVPVSVELPLKSPLKPITPAGQIGIWPIQ